MKILWRKEGLMDGPKSGFKSRVARDWKCRSIDSDAIGIGKFFHFQVKIWRIFSDIFCAAVRIVDIPSIPNTIVEEVR